MRGMSQARRPKIDIRSFKIFIKHPPNRIYLLLFVFGVTFIITIATQLKSHVINYLAGSMGILCGASLSHSLITLLIY
jgi:succinate-acetate transporter protein